MLRGQTNKIENPTDNDHINAARLKANIQTRVNCSTTFMIARRKRKRKKKVPF